MQRVTLSVDDDLLATLDRHMKKHRYASRSEALIATGYTFFDRAWWMWAFPALALCCTSGLVAVAASRE